MQSISELIVLDEATLSELCRWLAKLGPVTAVESAVVRYIVVQDTTSVHTLPPLERTMRNLPCQENQNVARGHRYVRNLWQVNGGRSLAR